MPVARKVILYVRNDAEYEKIMSICIMSINDSAGRYITAAKLYHLSNTHHHQ